ncbi:hypothetical protein LAZ67_21001460 [Cordylochernes scorpioides]|uniref:Uncharacterized protein n=1 Tax=Cordylochernes scorpioides TaxID=51811 RepID=A0ABY6LR99_9ARAC|nr:hypothetical protein LAZ67_21001460 [Cordylochernes scorpioides]
MAQMGGRDSNDTSVDSGMKKKEEADKIDLFMYLMGDRADDILRTFKFEKEEEATRIDSVLKAFDSHFCVRKNIIYTCEVNFKNPKRIGSQWTNSSLHFLKRGCAEKIKKTSTYVFPHVNAAERDLGCTETPYEWHKLRKRFERYLVVSGMKKKEEADKIDLFMYLMGDRADDISRTFKFTTEEEATKIDSVLKAFDSHFCVRKNIIYKRAKFNSRIQEDREPVDEFITSLYKLADSCEFECLHEQLIRDRIVVGVRDRALSERMQLDRELTLEKAVKMVRQQEAVRQQQVDLQRPSTSQKVNQVKFNSKKQSPKQQQQPSRM